MGLAEVPEARGAEGELPGADEGAVDGDGVVDAGVADVGVVEEVVDAGLEGVGVEQPAAEGDLDAELVLFVALAVERLKSVLLACANCDDGASGGEQRRRLVEAAVEAAEDPVELRDADGGAEAGGGLVLGELALEVGLRAGRRSGSARRWLCSCRRCTPRRRRPRLSRGCEKGGVPLPSLKTAPKR